MAKNNQGQAVKKDNSLKIQRTQKHKADRIARISKEKSRNPNKNAWRIGLVGRLRRLKKAAGVVGSDRRDLIENRIKEISDIIKNKGPIKD